MSDKPKFITLDSIPEEMGESKAIKDMTEEEIEELTAKLGDIAESFRTKHAMTPEQAQNLIKNVEDSVRKSLFLEAQYYVGNAKLVQLKQRLAGESQYKLSLDSGARFDVC